MSGLIDALEEVVSAFSKLADTSIKAFIAILLSIVTGAVVAALAGTSFDIVQSSVQGNVATEGAIDAGRTAYDFGSAIQDLYEYAKILAPVAIAVIGVGGAIVAVFKKLGFL